MIRTLCDIVLTMNKNPKLAALFNIIPGAGYLYIGRRKVLSVTMIVTSIVIIISDSFNPLLQSYYETPLNKWDAINLIALIALATAFMYDAYSEAVVAKRKK